jgi:hypothetical protein
MVARRDDPRSVRTLREHLWQGMAAVHGWRPASFYLLLTIPIVLLLALHLFETVDNPRRLALGLSLLFLFLGVLLIRAMFDILGLIRKLIVERHRSYQETLGDEEFLEALRASREEGGLPPESP